MICCYTDKVDNWNRRRLLVWELLSLWSSLNQFRPALTCVFTDGSQSSALSLSVHNCLRICRPWWLETRTYFRSVWRVHFQCVQCVCVRETEWERLNNFSKSQLLHAQFCTEFRFCPFDNYKIFSVCYKTVEMLVEQVVLQKTSVSGQFFTVHRTNMTGS